MKIVTKKDMSKTAATRWRNNYGVRIYLKYNSLPNGYEAEVYDSLKKLDNPTPEEVNNIIGCASWTDLKCDECGRKVDAVVEFETSEFPLEICHECLVDAANKIVWEITE